MIRMIKVLGIGVTRRKEMSLSQRFGRSNIGKNSLMPSDNCLLVKLSKFLSHDTTLESDKPRRPEL